MGCCCPEYGGAEDTAGMRIFDSFGLGCRWCSGKVGWQKCNLGSCWTWSRWVKGEERTAKKHLKLFSGNCRTNRVISRIAHYVERTRSDLRDVLLASRKTALPDLSRRSSSSRLTEDFPEEVMFLRAVKDQL